MKKRITLMLAMLCCSSLAFAQKIEIGMTRPELSKSFPSHASNFKTGKTSFQIKNFVFYGMTGVASFEFSRDKLTAFMWITPQPPRTLTAKENNQYALLVHHLQGDYGTGSPKPSPYNRGLLECKWQTSKQIAEVEYHPKAVKFTLIGAHALERAKDSQH